MTAHHVRQSIIRQDGERGGRSSVEHLHSRRGQRQKVHLYTIPIHVRQSLRFQVEQLWQEAGGRPRRCIVDGRQQWQVASSAQVGGTKVTSGV